MEVFALLQLITLLFSLTTLVAGSWAIFSKNHGALDKLTTFIIQPVTGTLLFLWSEFAVATYALSNLFFILEQLPYCNPILEHPIAQMVSDGLWLGFNKEWAGAIIGVNSLALTGHLIFLTIKRCAL